jgi:acyl-CoA synthetase (AMP-forming)/AMP-acid ligase II
MDLQLILEMASAEPEDRRLAWASDDPSVRRRLSSVGRPIPGIDVQVRHGEQPCPPGVAGDVYLRGAHIAGEYLGGEGSGDGWFATRDRGFLDADGYLFIGGRADDTIIRGGENIAPAEIEDILLRHPLVAECAVVGIEDDEWGHRIGAMVVPAPGAAPTIEDLRRHARQHLRSSKRPDIIELRDQLPYTDTGKLLRRVVQQELAPAADTTTTPASAAARR